MTNAELNNDKMAEGIELYEQGKYQEAIKCFDKAIKINPDNASACVNKGVALKNLDKYQEAIKCFDQAIKINSADAAIYYNKGVAFEYLGNYQEAIKSYNQALKVNPDYTGAKEAIKKLKNSR